MYFFLCYNIVTLGGLMETIVQKRIGCYAIIIEDNKMALVKKAGGGYKGKYDYIIF